MRDLKGLHREDLAMAIREGNSRNRRTDYRETREEHIEAFNSRFPSNSINPETSFDNDVRYKCLSAKCIYRSIYED